MNTARKILLMTGANWGNYVRNLAPTFWYRLNETSGSTAINYGSTASADGAVSGATIGQTGIIAPAPNAYLFDGVNDRVFVASASQAYPATLAILMQVVAAPSSNYDMIYTPFVLMQVRSSRQLRFTSNGINFLGMPAASALTLGVWYLISASFTDSTVSIYINGASVVSTTWTSPATLDSAIGIGGYTSYVNSLVDETIIFNRVLTAAEHLKLAQLAGLA
jgi:hypothetical protein